MKELSDLNNKPMSIMNFYGPVNIVQANNGSTVKIEPQTEKRKRAVAIIVKAIIGLATTIILWYIGTL